MADRHFQTGLAAAFVVMLITCSYGFWRVQVTYHELDTLKRYTRDRDAKWDPILQSIEVSRVEKWEPMLRLVLNNQAMILEKWDPILKAILQNESAIRDNQAVIKRLLETHKIP